MNRGSFNNSVDYLDLIKGLGIVRFDCGKNVSKNWEADTENSYCLENDRNIHERISEVFKKTIYRDNPINFLVKYYNENPNLLQDDEFDMQDIDSEFSFCIRPFTFDVKNEYLVYEEYNGDEELHSLSETCQRDIKIDISDFCLNVPHLTNGSEKFKHYQQIFTDIVGKVYNEDSKSNKIKHVTVILFIIKQKSEVDFSNFVIIFHRNRNIIDGNTPDCISQRNRLKAVLQSILQEKLKKIIQAQNKRIKDKAIKSAKAAIMSRNMSHNLGSHVMFYIKQKLDNAKKIYDTNVLANICPAGNTSITNEHVQDLSEGKIELPFLVGLGRFMNYLQERQDYIATIATDYIPANSTISFKDFIYDELKPDLRYKRHKETRSSPSETSGTQPKNLLMEYIAYSEGYDDSDKIVLKFGSFTGDNPKLEPQNEYGIRPYKEGTAELSSLEELRDFNVALPGGVMGRQAFFSIMENIIRNAAKHSGHRNDGKIEIDLDVVDPEKETWEDSRTKDCTEEQLRELYRRKSDDYYILAITDNMPHGEADVNHIIELLEDPYVDDNYQMKDTNKGLKEIRLSAAWIRRKQIDTEIDTTEEPPVISVQKIPFDDKTYAIRYFICLPKPKRIAFIGDNKLSPNDNTVEILRKNGCGLFCGEENWKDVSIPNYELVVLCTDQSSIDLKNISSRYLPYEINNVNIFKELEQRLQAIDRKQVDQKQVVNETIATYYKHWYAYISNSSQHKLCVLDEKSTYKHKKDSERGILLGTTASTDNDFYNGTIIFSTHFSGLSNKTREQQQPYSQAAFIEGITGNNSTDRLIRQTDWTEEWKYKHLAAGRLRVAIFDERIFSAISPLINKGKISIETDSIKRFADRFWLNDDNLTIDDLYSEFSKEYSGKISDGIINSIFDQFEDSLLSKDDFIKNVCLFISKSDDKYDINKTQLYYERRIWGYDIDIVNDKCIHIIGYNAPIQESVGIYDANKRNVTRVGRLIKQDDQYILDMYGVPHVKNKFDFISIHQGILDKIYNAFGINSLQSKDVVSAEKLKITYAIFNELSVKANPDKIKDTDRFFPQMIIHSGRSRPNSIDMPQMLPFVQFAAIDHAVRDCKYTLSELLYSAHY